MARTIRSMTGPTTLALSLAAALAAGTALATNLAPGVKLGTSAQEVSSALAAQGYEVLKYEREDDEIEVYVRKDGQRLELEIDPNTGQILEVEDED